MQGCHEEGSSHLQGVMEGAPVICRVSQRVTIKQIHLLSVGCYDVMRRIMHGVCRGKNNAGERHDMLSKFMHGVIECSKNSCRRSRMEVNKESCTES